MRGEPRDENAAGCDRREHGHSICWHSEWYVNANHGVSSTGSSETNSLGNLVLGVVYGSNVRRT